MIQAEVVAVVIGILVQDRDGGGSIVPTVPEIVKLLPRRFIWGGFQCKEYSLQILLKKIQNSASFTYSAELELVVWLLNELTDFCFNGNS